MTELKYDKDGLVPVIIQDSETKLVLTLAYAVQKRLKKRWLTEKHGSFPEAARNYGIKGRRAVIPKK